MHCSATSCDSLPCATRSRSKSVRSSRWSTEVGAKADMKGPGMADVGWMLLYIHRDADGWDATRWIDETSSTLRWLAAYFVSTFQALSVHTIRACSMRASSI